MKLRISLLVKLVFSFTLIIALGGILTIVLVKRNTEMRFRQHISQADIALAGNLSRQFETYYLRQGSWDGIEEALRPAPLPDEESRGPAFGMQGRMMRNSPEMLDRMLSLLPQIIITDAEGRIVFDSTGRIKGEAAEEDRLDSSLTLEAEGRVIGYLLVGSMIDAALNPAQRAFLRATTRSVGISTLVVVLAAVIIASLIAFQLIRPLKNMQSGAEEISRGNYDARVETGSRDEIGDLAKSFNMMGESLKRAVEWRKRIIADAAHELRTPATLLQGKLELLKEGVYAADRRQLASLHEEALLLGNLIEELDILSQAEADSLRLQKEQAGLGRLAEKTGESYRREIERKSIHFEVRIGPQQQSPADTTDISVLCDKQKITQVFSNLISNALRFTPEGGNIAVSIDTGGVPAESETAEKHEGQSRRKNSNGGRQVRPAAAHSARIRVEDSGPGIAAADRQLVFERFYRADTGRSRRTGGRGLGLAISKAIIEAHGGEIRAEKSSLGGAAVIFTLPKA